MSDDDGFDLFKVTRAAFSSAAKLINLQLRGHGVEGDDDNAEPVDEAPFLQQLGVAARPVVSRTLRALGLRFGEEVFPLKVWDKAKTPTDLAEGETRTFACGDTTVHIKHLTSGDIHVVAKSASGKVYLQGGGATADKPVAHEGSRTAGHVHGPGLYVAGPYPVTGTSLTEIDAIDVGEGSANVLVPRTSTP